MALQTDYNYNGLTIPNAYLRVLRIFGGKTEGWNSLVQVFPAKPAPYVQEFDADGNDITPEPIPPITTFNQGAKYNPDNMNGLELVYIAMQEKLGGVAV